jgi:hypothetical protein
VVPRRPEFPGFVFYFNLLVKVTVQLESKSGLTLSRRKPMLSNPWFFGNPLTSYPVRVILLISKNILLTSEHWGRLVVLTLLNLAEASLLR